ncbi:MAG: hypothetical protein U1E65_05215 [Myxococcota bacterium]
MSSAPPVKKKRRPLWVRLLAWAFLALTAVVALTVIALLTLPVWLPEAKLRQIAAEKLSPMLGAPVRIGHLSVDLLSGISIDGLCVGPPPGYQRDLLCVKRVEVSYHLAKDAVTVERALIVEPHLVLETVGGKRNLDVVLEHLSGGPSEPAPPEEPRKPGPIFDPSFPLTEAKLEVVRAGVERLQVELVGEGPSLALDGLSVLAQASLDAEKLHAELSVERPAGTTVRFGAGDLEIASGIDLKTVLRLDAKTDQGLRALTAQLMLDLGLRPETLKIPAALPTDPLSLGLTLDVDGASDRARLSRMVLKQGAAPLVELEASVEGLLRFLAALNVDAAILKDLAAWPDAGPGLLALRGPTLHLDLDRLEPWVAAFVPGLIPRGRATIALSNLEGTLPELMKLSPRQLALSVELEQVGVRWRARALDVSGLSGTIQAERRGSEPLVLGGALRAGPLSVATLELARAELGLAARAESLDIAELGATSATVSLGLAELKLPGIRLGRGKIQAALFGQDLLTAERPLTPIQARVRVGASGVVAPETTLADLELRLDAEVDRLLTASRGPIHAALKTTAHRLQAGPAAAAAVELNLDLRARDPRENKPFDATARLALGLEKLTVPGTALGQAKLTTSLDARGIDLGAKDPTRILDDARVDLGLSVDDAEIALGSSGTLHAPIELSLALHARPKEERAEVEKLAVKVADLVKLGASATLQDILHPSPAVDLRLELDPLDLARLVARPEVARMKLGLDARGSLGLSLRAQGHIPADEAWWARVEDPPLKIDLALLLTKVGLTTAEQKFTDLGGRVGLVLARGKLETSVDLSLGTYADAERQAEGLELNLGAGLSEGLWSVAASVGLDRLARPGTKGPAILGTRAVLDAIFAPYGDVQIRRLYVAAPDAGLSLNAEGRLERRRFGVLRPELRSDLDVDFGKLKPALALLSPASAPAPTLPLSGALSLHLGLQSPSDRLISFEGALALRQLGVVLPGLSVEGASGRLPVSQSILVAAPDERSVIRREEGSVLSAFEELEARLLELTHSVTHDMQLLTEESDVLVKAPRTADYESMRPYYAAATGLTIDKLVYGRQTIEAIAMDISYGTGLLRLDRFAMRVWGGDVFGDVALQIAGPGHLKTRVRATVTDLNLDDPVADALARPRETDPAVRARYLASGNIDVRFDFSERTLNGYLDLTKMGPALLVRLIDSLDPKGEDTQLQETRSQLNTYGGILGSTIAGVELKGVVVSIRQNLLALDFVWSRTWIEFPRLWLLVTQPTIGSVVVNGLAPIRRYSLSSFLAVPALRTVNELVFGSLLGGREILVKKRDELEPPLIEIGEGR